ncbi:TatD family hydrolase [Corallincola spongiicola]|uniref:Hydrolase TatD n=1 Tax=Corallincola spongiicola TaxID=2520508 RepID=A0ABY1WKZ6_9GAMM|nr:TatD family hydrolase [Corallincola spongiicola]TAA40999.1 hydrolase TatD [Corallincola spongiicola]
MNWVDIGVNLTNKQFKDDAADVVERALSVDVNQLILTGTSLLESQQALSLAKRWPGTCFSTAGIHPHDAKEFQPEQLTALAQLLTQPQVVAVGECGLDFNRDFSPRPVQCEVLEQQLSLAAELNMPVFLHERDASDTLLAILKPWRDKLPAAVVHCFTGSEIALRQYLELDLHIGVTGWVCDERRGTELLAMMPLIPAGRLMLETDAPFLIPRDLQPKPKRRRNEPCYLPHIAATIAAKRGETLAQLSEHTLAASQRFFGLM